MSAILAQLKQYQETAAICADFNDLISVEQLAEQHKKSVVQVKRLCEKLGVAPTHRFGKSYLYSKKAFMEATRLHDVVKLHQEPAINKKAIC